MFDGFLYNIKWLMYVISKLPFRRLLRNFMLGTKDAHKLYEQFGFTALKAPERFMQVHQPNIYQSKEIELEENKNKQNSSS